MKMFAVMFMFLSVITFRSCGEAEGHSYVDLRLDPVYIGETIYLTPVVTYNGIDPGTMEYNHSIARIEKVINDSEEVVYENKGSGTEYIMNAVLENGEEEPGETVELKLEPGLYEVHLIADYKMQHDNGAEDTDHHHKMRQTIEVK